MTSQSADVTKTQLGNWNGRWLDIVLFGEKELIAIICLNGKADQLMDSVVA